MKVGDGYFSSKVSSCLSIGIWSIFSMTPSSTQTHVWYRPKGWFNEREEKILVNRILYNDPSKGDMHNQQAINPKFLPTSLPDFELWSIYCFGLIWEIPSGPPGQCLTLTLRNLGFGTFDANWLSISTQFIGAVTMCIISYTFQKCGTRERCLASLRSSGIFPAWSPWQCSQLEAVLRRNMPSSQLV